MTDFPHPVEVTVYGKDGLNWRGTPRKNCLPHMTIEERIKFIGWTATEAGCHEWNGTISSTGYGHLRVHRKSFGVHRLGLEKKLGRPIQPGMLACHHCDNRKCMNPDHLFEGTYEDNVRDAVSKGRARGGRTGGHTTTIPAEVVARAIQLRSSGATLRAVKEATGVSPTYLSELIRGVYTRRDAMQIIGNKGENQ